MYLIGNCIKGLLIFTKWLGFALAIVCIPLSILLFIANLPLGILSAGVFIASLLAAVGVALLIPKTPVFLKVVGGILLVAAVVIMGLICFTEGGFPALDIFFI